MAYDRIEPIGDRRLDLLTTHLAHVIFNSMRMVSPAKIEPLGPEAFMPKWQVPTEEAAAEAAEEQLKAKAARAFGAFGGQVPSGS